MTKQKVAVNFPLALARFKTGSGPSFHSGSDTYSFFNRTLSHPGDGFPKKTLLASLSADKTQLMISFSPAHWGAKNRVERLKQAFGIGGYIPWTYDLVNKFETVTLTDPDWIARAKKIAASKAKISTSADDILSKKAKYAEIYGTKIHETIPQPSSVAPSNNEPSVEELYGLKKSARTGLNARVASFYLLAAGAAEKPQKYDGEYHELAKEMAKELLAYMAYAAAGELTHYRLSEAPDWLQKVKGDNKSYGRQAFWTLYSANPVDAMKKATAAFKIKGAWSSAFGGPKWAQGTDYALQYLREEISDVLFVDFLIDLEHNTGSMLNKWYETSELRPLLDAKFSGKPEDYVFLMARTNSQTAKKAYVESLRSGKMIKKLVGQFGLTDVVIPRWYECEKCGTELEKDGQLCKTCLICSRCGEMVATKRHGFSWDSEEISHTCPSQKFIVPAIKWMK